MTINHHMSALITYFKKNNFLIKCKAINEKRDYFTFILQMQIFSISGLIEGD
jgi:hypothetical protein